MTKVFKSRKSKQGLAPGSLVHIGRKNLDTVHVAIMDFNAGGVNEKQAKNLDECLSHIRDEGTVTWVNIDGVHDTELIRHLGEELGIHTLVLEDIMNTDQRPKFEDHDDYLFIVLKMLYLKNGTDNTPVIASEQVSLVVGPHYIISFQEDAVDQLDTFGPVRERIRQDKWRSKKLGSDYLAYALLDSIVDNYFVVLEKQGDLLEEMELQMLEETTQKSLQEIHTLKREMLLTRKYIWPLREVIHALQRSDNPMMKEETRLYLRDVYDHVVQVIDIIETYRELVAGLMELYLTSVSNKMNSIMQVLTIISTIFIPLTFIVGVYGMNFEFMPELHWKWGYPMVWVVMVLITVGMLRFFRRKEWI